MKISNHLLNCLGQPPKQRSSLVRYKKAVTTEEIWLSIGKIFHKLSLTGQMINVVRHAPKHPHDSLYYNYRYRFLAPDNDTYEVNMH